MFQRGRNMSKPKNGKQPSTDSSNGAEFEAVIRAFGRNAEILDNLSDRATQAIVDLNDQEDITHHEIETRYIERCKAEYHRLENAPVQNDELPSKIDLEHFRQKLRESNAAEYEKKKREEEVDEEIEEKKEQISAMEEILRKKLEVINAAKRLMN
uniref:Uncharacterized protein n=1 Tax=Panagrolaimus sp. ES5 TaxID=591445 RepID=A0AC34FW26_9BILA